MIVEFICPKKRITNWRGPVASLGFAALLAGCSSTGGAPVPTHSSSGLFLCEGISIANAPPADRQGRITGVSSSARVKGMTLLRFPATGCLSSAFGPRRGGAGRVHEGIDIYTRTPAAFVASADGTVTFVGKRRGYGTTLEIDHGKGVLSRYAHLSRVDSSIKSGKQVVQGQRLGLTGRTGNATAVHLHYEILVNGKAKNVLKLPN
ncbi:MAG: M23 family metallopeptidase [Pseudomonadota bacterium]